jgi:transcriptional regulator with GAF, ATPase, and Fis domain
VLSLSNEPQRLLNMTLDTLGQVLDIECCWVQTINARKRSLHLAAERGFSSEMRREISAVDMGHNFSKQVVGTGNGIVIPDLSRDGRYGLSSFRAAGYRWLVAVPLMTYRVHGVLGIASRHKKRLHKETADLVMVIAGLIGTALNKASLSQEFPVPEKPEPSPGKESRPDPITPRAEIPSSTVKLTDPRDLTEENVAKPAEGAFHKHAHKMNAFRRLHH